MSKELPVYVIERDTYWEINCAACRWHSIPKKGKSGANWTFNGNVHCPTFTPSVNELLNGPGPEHREGIPSRRCHYIVAAGKIKYCGDCTHALKGQTLPMIPFDPVRVLLSQIEKQAKKGKIE